MGLFDKLVNFGQTKPKAVAFVDFENWYISLDRLYHKRPDMKEWMAELQKTYNIREIYVFGDFSNQSLRAEIPRIREITNLIIETQNASAYVTKDFTDFIMLDHIYQKALEANDIQAYIIFSCDGHFSSSVSFLKNRCGKTVEVYGVKGAMSNQLRNTATRCTEIPLDASPEQQDQKYYDMIFANLKYLSDNNRGASRMYPSFVGTVDAVSAYYSASEDDISRALRYLLDRGYIYQTEEKVGGRTLKVLNVNWELSRREGVYDPEDAKEADKSAKKPTVNRQPRQKYTVKPNPQNQAAANTPSSEKPKAADKAKPAEKPAAEKQTVEKPAPQKKAEQPASDRPAKNGRSQNAKPHDEESGRAAQQNTQSEAKTAKDEKKQPSAGRSERAKTEKDAKAVKADTDKAEKAEKAEKNADKTEKTDKVGNYESEPSSEDIIRELANEFNARGRKTASNDEVTSDNFEQADDMTDSETAADTDEEKAEVRDDHPAPHKRRRRRRRPDHPKAPESDGSESAESTTGES